MMFQISAMRSDDFEEVWGLWQTTKGVGLSPTENRDTFRFFLARNPGLSLVARQERNLVGAILCGHDGRRGYLYHLAVAEASRNQGIGRALVEAGLAGLAAAGIPRTTIVVYAHNESGQRFWRNSGWNQRTDLVVLQKDMVPAPIS
jgi:N-acetylglutamate synthase